MKINRLKQIREEIAEKEARLDQIEASRSKEERSVTAEELSEVETIDEEIEALIKERSFLEKQEKRKEEKAKEELEKEEERQEVKVTADNLKTKDARNAKTFSMIQGMVSGNSSQEEEARKSLIEGGHLPKPEEARNFSTLKDGKGGILIPTSVANEIWDIEQQFGFIPQFANNMGDIVQSEMKIPNVLGRPSFSAVTQGSAISGSGFNLGGITLKALKWGAIIDWTNEVDESVGAKLMPIIMSKVAEALAYTKDDTFFNGDGTSTYNSIKGLETLKGNVNYVRSASAATGNTGFDTLDADDFLKPIENVTPGARSGGVFVMHPNLVLKLKKLKDGQGMYIYGMPSEQAPVGTLFGYPVQVSEAFPITDGVSKTACAFVNPRHIGYANGRVLRTDVLREATITNEDGTSVNLATSDAQALRWTAIFDIKVDNNTRTTAGTEEGAFAVLTTAAS